MIDKFSVIYVGQIELDNIGKDGTPADERRYPNERLIEALDHSTRLARLLDELGFYALWTAEHHFQREGYECLPNLILLSTYLATQTSQLKLGCAFNIVPMWHPLRLAEDYAMADILTGGRVIFGVGRGYHSREVETFGAPVIDNDANKELFEEQMEIILKAFNEESFSHQGKHYTIPAQVPYRGLRAKGDHPGATAHPPPGGGLAAHSQWPDAGIRGPHGIQGDGLHHRRGSWWKACSAPFRSRPPGMGALSSWARTWPWAWVLYLADTQEEAIRRIRPSHDERYKWFAPFGFVRYTDEQGRSWGTPGAPARIPSLEDGVSQRAWLCGPPDQMVSFLKETEEKYPGLEHILLLWPEGLSWQEYREQLQIFAREVMPHFRSVEAAGAGRAPGGGPTGKNL